MPRYHQLEATNFDGSAPTGSPLDGPADYRPQMISFNAHNQPNSHAHQQQQYLAQQYPREQYPEQQRSHHQRSQRPQMQAGPVHQANAVVGPQSHSKQHKLTAASAVKILLPHCTTDTRLSESQVIAVTDVAGSLRELVLLALGAKDGEEGCIHRLGSVLGSEQTLSGIIDFFSGEFEVE
jgi:hypothetical protein